MGASQSSIQDPSITGINKIGDKLVFKKINGTEDSIPIDTVSIQSVVVDNTGILVITRTNGSKDGPFNVKGNPGETGPKGSIGATGSQGPQGLKGDPSTVPGPPGRDSALSNGIPSGPGMYAIYDPTCNNDDILKGVTGGAVNGVCRGNTNFINHQGSGATGGFRFINFKNDKKNIAMETDGEGNLGVNGNIISGGKIIASGRDIVRELDELYINLNKNFARKNQNYRIESSRGGFLQNNPDGVKWIVGNGQWESVRLVESDYKG